MPEPKDTTKTAHFKGFTNTQCEFFPCHTGVENPEENFSCLFCFCPLVFLECPGPYEVFTDKRISNLRDVTRSENMRNQGFKGKTGTLGICQRGNKWQAYIHLDGTFKHLGMFSSKDAAVKARKEAEAIAGYHPNSGTRPCRVDNHA